MTDVPNTIPTRPRPEAALVRAPQARHLALAVVLSRAVACGSDSDSKEPDNGAGPLYAIMYEVYDDVLDFNGGAFTPVQFDGRLFLMVPGGEEENWATQVHEVVDGVASPRVKLPGWSYQFVKLR